MKVANKLENPELKVVGSSIPSLQSRKNPQNASNRIRQRNIRKQRPTKRLGSWAKSSLSSCTSCCACSLTLHSSHSNCELQSFWFGNFFRWKWKLCKSLHPINPTQCLVVCLKRLKIQFMVPRNMSLRPASKSAASFRQSSSCRILAFPTPVVQYVICASTVNHQKLLEQHSAARLLPNFQYGQLPKDLKALRGLPLRCKKWPLGTYAHTW